MRLADRGRLWLDHVYEALLILESEGFHVSGVVALVEMEYANRNLKLPTFEEV